MEAVTNGQLTKDGYPWLLKENAPRMLIEALKLYGVKEKVGSENNPEILAWAKETGLKQYNADSIPWCGLFVALIAKRAGKPLPKKPLWARDWAKWGEACEPELGCILVFERGTGGHVGLYVGEDLECYHVLGGNQSDMVRVSRLKKDRLLAARNLYLIGKPKNVRKVWLKPTGEVSNNEA